LIMLYIFITILVYSIRYDASKKGVQKYFKYLKYLNKNYSDADETDEEE
jgi:NADH:ubiquinone oxidoreductase subunit 5 (subunit L)/multisubunit Na+/H+ antiporter MnhA subunit